MKHSPLKATYSVVRTFRNGTPKFHPFFIDYSHFHRPALTMALALVFLFFAAAPLYAKPKPVAFGRLPPGFKIHVYADNLLVPAQWRAVPPALILSAIVKTVKYMRLKTQTMITAPIGCLPSREDSI